MKNYQNQISTKSNIENVFIALTKNIDKWWTRDFEGTADKIGDEFTITFGTTFKSMKVEELITNKKIVWKCIDALIDITELPNNKEWIGTKIIWEIESINQNVEIKITHLGLNKEVACFDICNQGWNSFLESLRLLLEENKGKPFINY